MKRADHTFHTYVLTVSGHPDKIDLNIKAAQTVDDHFARRSSRFDHQGSFDRFVHAFERLLDADLVVATLSGLRAVLVERHMSIELSLVRLTCDKRTEHSTRKHIATVVVTQIEDQVGDILCTETVESGYQLLIVIDIEAHIEQITGLLVRLFDFDHFIHIDSRTGEGRTSELHIPFRGKHRSSPVVGPRDTVHRNIDRTVVHGPAQTLIVAFGHLLAIDRRDEVAAHETGFRSRRSGDDDHDHNSDIIVPESGRIQQIDTRTDIRLAGSTRQRRIAFQTRIVIHTFLPLPMTVFAVHLVLSGYTVENREEKEVITKTVIERNILDGTIPEITALHVLGNPFVHAAVFSVPLLN